MAAPTYRLTYYASPGRADPIRLAFAAAGIAFEDRRLAGDALTSGRDAGTIAAPFGQFPVLEVDGDAIGQSCAILRYVGRVSHGPRGAGAARHATRAPCRNLADRRLVPGGPAHRRAGRQRHRPARRHSDRADHHRVRRQAGGRGGACATAPPAAAAHARHRGVPASRLSQAKAFATFASDRLPRMVKGIADVHKAGSKHLFGDALTIADLMLVYIADAATAFAAIDIAASAPALKALCEAVRSSPLLAAYYAALPEVFERDAVINGKAKGDEAAAAGAGAGAAADGAPDAKRARHEGEGASA